MDDIVRLNGNVMSAKSCSFTLEGVPYTGFQAVDYEDGLEIEHVHGNNQDGTPLGFTEGEYKVDGFSFTILKDVWIVKMQPQLVLLSAAAGATGSYGGARFTFVAQYQEGLITATDSIETCRVIKTKDAYAKGNGAQVVAVTLAALKLRRNGVTLYNPARFP